MVKIERGSIKALVIWVVTFAAVAVILWPILDLLYSAIITHSEFTYSIEEHVVKPVAFGCVGAVVFWAIDKKLVTNKKD